MGSKTNYLENKLIDFRLRGQVYVPPTILYVGLFTSLPGDAGTGGVEVSGDGYARVAVACNMTNWSATNGAGTTTASTGVSGTVSNNIDIQFPTALEDWGAIVGAGLWDHPTAGNLTEIGSIVVVRPVYAGDTPKILAGQLLIQEDD